MRRVLMAFAVWAAACALPEPELEVRRENPANGAPEQGPPPDITFSEILDAGPASFDGGVCCEVLFRLAAAGEAEVELKGPDSFLAVPMTLDAGVWSAVACLPLNVTQRYFYEVAYEGVGADGGTDYLRLSKTNDDAPKADSPWGELNVFDPAGASSCTALDAGVHAQVPDAG